LEPGQDLPDWALELVPSESSFDVMKAAGEGCQFVMVMETEGKAEACPLQALSADVPYCMKHALEAGYEVTVSKPEPKPEEPKAVSSKPAVQRTRPRRKEAATA
jgi:hypothetical protein